MSRLSNVIRHHPLASFFVLAYAASWILWIPLVVSGDDSPTGLGFVRVSWIGAAGLADIEQRRPATEATVYLWFSMTKIATATAVVQLAERGKLGLDEPVATYVPEFPHSPHGSRSPATICHLLSHSAGLPNPIPVRWIHPAGAPAPDSRQFTLRLLDKHRRLKGVPGEQARYSNLPGAAEGLTTLRRGSASMCCLEWVTAVSRRPSFAPPFPGDGRPYVSDGATFTGANLWVRAPPYWVKPSKTS